MFKWIFVTKNMLDAIRDYLLLTQNQLFLEKRLIFLKLICDFFVIKLPIHHMKQEELLSHGILKWAMTECIENGVRGF